MTTPSSETCPVCAVCQQEVCPRISLRENGNYAMRSAACYRAGFERVSSALTVAQAERDEWAGKAGALASEVQALRAKLPLGYEVELAAAQAEVERVKEQAEYLDEQRQSAWAEVERLTREKDEAKAALVDQRGEANKVHKQIATRAMELLGKERARVKVLEADMLALEEHARRNPTDHVAHAMRSVRPAAMLPAPTPQERCTGLTAIWCPVHGNCACPDDAAGERTFTDDKCSLHSASSAHADTELAPTLTAPAPAPTGSAPTPRLSVTALPWLAIRDTYEDREHRQRAVACWVDKRADGDLWIVAAPDGSSCLVGGERSARLIADAVNAYRAPTGSEGAAADGLALIAAERKRQIEKEGWTPEHDDEHEDEALAKAAACYADPDRRMTFGDYPMPVGWPWDAEAWKPTPDNRVRELVKAGALIAAEIDRLKREDGAAPSRGEGTPEAAKGLCGTFKCPRCGSATPHAHPDETAHQALIREEEVARRCDHPPEHWRGTELIVECLLCNGTGIKAPKEQP